MGFKKLIIIIVTGCTVLKCSECTANTSSNDGLDIIRSHEAFVPGEKVYLSVPGLIGYTARNLPVGLKLNKKTGVISGTAKKPTATDGVTVAFTKKGSETLTACFYVAAIPKVTVTLKGDTEKCRVTGGNKAYLVGKKVSLAAKSPKGTAFMGWACGGNPWPDADSYRDAKVRYVMTRENLDIVATFEKEKVSIDVSALKNAKLYVGSNISEGMIVIPVTTQSGLKLLKASKLPTGLRLKKSKATGSWSVIGKPKKKGLFNVTLKATAKSGAVEAYTLPVNVFGESESMTDTDSDNDRQADLGGVQLWKDGPYWAECNVGASKPEECGFYFGWGDTVGYTPSGGVETFDLGQYCLSNITWVSSSGREMTHSPFILSFSPTYGKDYKSLLSSGYIDSTGNLVAEHDAATVHLGVPWHMPTDAEVASLINNCDTRVSRFNGTVGYLVTGRGNFSSKSIFLPLGGYGSGNYLRDESSMAFWTSSSCLNNSELAWTIYRSDGCFCRGNDFRYYGQLIRPLRNSVNSKPTSGQASDSISDSSKLGGIQLWKNGPFWSECNVGATYPEEYGYYFWWGDVIGYLYNGMKWIAVDGSELCNPFVEDEGKCPTYGKDNSSLLSLGYIDTTGNLALIHDAARAHLGATWRMPTSDEWAVLVNRCNRSFITTNGVYGCLFVGMGDYASKSIFLPAGGFSLRSSLLGDNEDGRYWSSTPVHNGDAANFMFQSGSVWSYYNFGRCAGESIRPLRYPADSVPGSVPDSETTRKSISDMGPDPNPELGGVQLWKDGPYWADCNVGATAPEETGLYFWWGDTVGITLDSAMSEGMGYYPYSFDPSICETLDKTGEELKSLGYIDSIGSLVPAHDAATVHLGLPWRMPTYAEIKGLYDKCIWSWTLRKGVYGHLIKGIGIYSSNSIFLPSTVPLSRKGYYWSATIDLTNDADPIIRLLSWEPPPYENPSHLRPEVCASSYAQKALNIRPVRGNSK